MKINKFQNSLSKNELKNILGGRELSAEVERAECTFPDGTGWDAGFSSHQAAFLAGDRCVSQGGSIRFYDPWLNVNGTSFNTIYYWFVYTHLY